MNDSDFYPNVVIFRPRSGAAHRAQLGAGDNVVSLPKTRQQSSARQGLHALFRAAGRDRATPRAWCQVCELMVQVLSLPGAVGQLARDGYAKKICRLIGMVRPEQQARILSAPNAVCGLAYHGHADAVWEIVRSLDAEKQTGILAAHGAVVGLAYRGKAEAVWNLVATLDVAQKRRIARASFFDVAMRENGYGAEVAALQAELRSNGLGPRRPRP